MLDLSILKEKTWDVKLFDGEVLHVKRPSQRMVVEMMGYEKTFKKQKDIKKTLESFSNMLLDILNNNINDKQFDLTYVENNFDMAIGMAFVNSYMEFVKEINSNPN